MNVKATRKPLHFHLFLYRGICFSVLFTACLLFSCRGGCQVSVKVDSILSLIKIQKTDTTRLRLYTSLCDICNASDNLKYANPGIKLADSILSYIQDTTERKKILNEKASLFRVLIAYYTTFEGFSSPKSLEYHLAMLKLYKESGNKAGIADDIYSIGYDYARAGDVMKQLNYYTHGIELLRKMGYKKGTQLLLSAISNIYINYGDTVQAMEKMKAGLSVAQEINDTSSIGSGLINLGELYDRTKHSVKALECYRKAILLYKKKNKMGVVGLIYFRIGLLYYDKKDFDTALYYYNKCLPLVNVETDNESEKQSNFYVLGQVLRYIGLDYTTTGQTEKGIDYYNQALKIVQQYNFNMEVVRCYQQLAGIYFSIKKYRIAKQYCTRLLNVLKNNNDLVSLGEAENLFSRVDSALGDYKGAYAHYTQYALYRHRFNNAALRKTIIEEKFQGEYNKKEAEAKAAMDKKDALAQEEKQKEKILIYSGGSVLLLVMAFALFVSMGYRQKQRANRMLTDKNKIIEEKNRDITSSITYAKRIQHASLPKQEEFTTYFPESFILFKPKDIVSGDFYFFHKKNDHTVYVAAADCTGHGVPGAFMSILCSEKLNLSVAQNSDTSSILNCLNKELKKSLHQSVTEESTRDGMDIALCQINRQEGIVKFAGANRPFWLIRNGKTEMDETKGTKRAIGGFTEDHQHFDTHEIKVQPGDTFYLFSDGYADTFSGGESKKLTTKKFRQLLISIQNKDMKAQREYLDKFIEEWKGGLEQVDDMLVIGIRV